MTVRDKAEEIRQRGEAKRGNFSPEPNSGPVKAYKYFYANSGTDEPDRENFCHFWRVVVIWAPLLWVTLHTIVPVADGPVGRTLGRAFKGDNGDTFLKVLGWAVGILSGGLVAFLLVNLVIMIIQNWAVLWLPLVLTSSGVLLFVGLIIGLTMILEQRHRLRAAERELLFERRLAGLEPWPEPKPVVEKVPSKFRVFLSHITDYLVLIAQWIRTKKWKICPYVEIPE